ncbi:MAG: DUF6600 domain-containing protein [Bryobacteraceae bacterium]
MAYKLITTRNRFFAALIVVLLAVAGALYAQNPDLSQNPAPSPDVQNQDQAAGQDQMQGQDQNNNNDNEDQMQDQGSDQPANPPTLGPRPDTQSEEDKYGRPPMSEQPPKPSPNVGPYGNNPSYGSPNYGGPNAEPGYGNSDNSNDTSENNGVGRVSLIHGDVSTQRGDSGDWSAAVLNAPLMTGDKISTADQARAEIQLDYANILRVSGNTQANIVNLTRKNIQIQLGHGMANYTVLGNSDADAEIDTPNVAIRTERRAASFRILVSADDHTEVLVRRGEVEITTPQGGTRVGENQFITIRGTGDQTQYRIGDAPARDDWDQWNSDRDHVIQSSVSRRHTNDYYTGTQDMDGYGNWQDVPDYGQAWFPNEGSDWAPYSSGSWVYEPYWGWTWVSYEPWGWAPYHYGRWFQYNGAWGWWPGPVAAYPYYQPVWAPAYVSFFGYGGGFGFDAGWGWGSIGWFPIGPCDYFHPWWGGWGGRFGYTGWNGWNRGGFAPLHRGDRFSNFRLAHNDPHFRGATMVDANHFGGRGGTFTRANHTTLQNAHFATGNLPVTPTRNSLSASGRSAAPGSLRNTGANQHFFSPRGTAIRGNTHSFAREQASISNAMRRNRVSPVNRSAVEGRGGFNGTRNRGVSPQSNARMSQPGFRQPGRGNEGVGSRPNATMGSRTAEQRGNTRFGPPRSGTATGPSGRAVSRANSGGWHNFTPMAPRAPAEPARPSSRMGAENRGSFGPSRGYSGPEGRPYAGGPPQNRGYSGPSGRGPENRGFGGPSGRAPENRGFSGPSGRAPESRGYSGPYGRTPEGRGYGGSRPPLNMRQPIVTPRGYGNPHGGRGASPAYGGRAPSYGGGHAPSYGGGRGFGGGAPSHGGGSFGGGGSHGGGGGSHGGGSGGSHGGGGGSHGGGGGHGGHR